jgi:hypothetical protein
VLKIEIMDQTEKIQNSVKKIEPIQKPEDRKQSYRHTIWVQKLEPVAQGIDIMENVKKKIGEKHPILAKQLEQPVQGRHSLPCSVMIKRLPSTPTQALQSTTSTKKKQEEETKETAQAEKEEEDKDKEDMRNKSKRKMKLKTKQTRLQRKEIKQKTRAQWIQTKKYPSRKENMLIWTQKNQATRRIEQRKLKSR